MSTFAPSPQQAAILAAAQSPERFNMVIEAGAGSGKTTTLIQVYKSLVGRSIFLAFGKANQEDLQNRGVPARTFNSLGFGALRQAMTTGQVDGDKVRNYLRSTLNPGDAARYVAFCSKLVDLAKNSGIGAIIDDTEQNWFDLIDKHDLELQYSDANYATAVSIARAALTWSSHPSTIEKVVDYNDQVYVPVLLGLRLPKFDNVLTDESQDLNAIQRAIVRKILAERGRLVAVGDKAQAIFGFRGADSDSLDLIASDFDCRRLPLTVSYRCARKIVDYARQFGAIDARDDAPEGLVREVESLDDTIAEAAPGDLYVSRTTRTLIEAAYRFLKAHKSAFVLGREIGEGLVKLVSRFSAPNLDVLADRLETWTTREVEKAQVKGKDAKAESIRDKTDCVVFLIETLVGDEHSIGGLIDLIQRLFTNRAGGVMLATIHKAKGLEARRVYWLNHDWTNRWAKQPWQQQQETNLKYVAATRAKEELVLIPTPARSYK